MQGTRQQHTMSRILCQPAAASLRLALQHQGLQLSRHLIRLALGKGIQRPCGAEHQIGIRRGAHTDIFLDSSAP